MPTRGEVEVPYNFTARDYQRPSFRAFASGIRRIVKIWHRRTGKDKSDWCLLVREAATGRVGTYWHVFPTYTQGKKALWDGIDRDGFRIRDHCPPALIKGKPNESDMSIDLINGSVLQVIGADKVDSLVGTNPIGIVFSEYSLMSPGVWQFLQPIIIENGGFAIFNFTPRGANHAQDLYEMAQGNPRWFAELLTVDDTGVLNAEQLAEARAGTSEEVFRQEYYCDFEAGNEGSYYGRLLASAKAAGRLGDVAVDPALPVHTAWDLGVGDATAIWFFQVVGRERRYVDYYESSGEGLPHYIRVLQQRGYVYGRHFAPHDIEVREFSSGTSRLETARQLGIRFEVLPQGNLEDGIEAVRLLLPRCWFDAERCKDGIAALRAYHKAFDDKRQTWRTSPEHDWSSHAADSFRYSAMANVERATVTFAAPTAYVPGYMQGGRR